MNSMVELIVYTTSAFVCPFCVRVKAALAAHGFHFIEKDTADPLVRAELAQKRPSARTVPQVFLPDGSYVGDCTETLAMIKNGKLDLLIDMYEPSVETKKESI